MATLQAAQPASTPPARIEYKPLSPTQLAWRRFKRNRLAVAGLLVVLAFCVVAILAPILAPHPYDRTSLFEQWAQPGSNPKYVLGSDMLGRDILSRMMWGVRISLTVALIATTFVVTVALVLGFVSGYFGGVWDYVLNRIFEVVAALPGVLFMILFVLLLGTGIIQVTIAISILSWPGPARLVRAQVLAHKERDFITASQSLGASTPFVAIRHIVPNILNPLIVYVSFLIPGFIAAEAGLSFLGYGINEPLPSLGKMIGDIGQYLSSPNYLYVGVIPTVALAVLVLAFSFFGDGLRDALDPASDRATV